MKFLIFFIIIFINKNLAEKSCEEKQNDSETLAKLVFRAQSLNQKLIENDEDFKDFCIEGKNGVKSIKEYSSCLNGIAKQVISIIYSNSIKAVKKFCSQDVENAKKFLTCYDKEKTKGIRECAFKFSEAASYSIQTQEEIEVIPSVCCGYAELSDCVDRVHKKPCKTDGFFDDFSYARGFRQSIFGSAVDLMCSSFKSETCNTKEKALMNKVKIFSKKNPVNINNFSLVKKLKLISERLVY